MKLTSYLIMATLLLSSCSKADIEYEKDFDKSQRAWTEFKASNNNSYRYEVTGGSWVGTSWKTTVSVSKGLTIKRAFTYTRFFRIDMPAGGWTQPKMQEILDSMNVTAQVFLTTYGEAIEDVLSWTEGPGQIGVHKNTPATSYLTLDEIYDVAKNDWLKRRGEVETFFEAKNNGLISNCGYVPNGCQDDCFRGINIASIEVL